MSLQEVNIQISRRIPNPHPKPKQYYLRDVIKHFHPDLWLSANECFALLDEIFPDMEFCQLAPLLAAWSKKGYLAKRPNPHPKWGDRRLGSRVQYRNVGALANR